MIPNHKTMPTEQLREEMLSRIPESTWENDFEQSPQNINWMFVVYNIEHCETADDLNDLLSCIETHYAGPISIHEGWGGCEADSNAELISDKLRFDLGECPEGINADLYMAAVEADFIDFESVEEALGGISRSYSIGDTQEEDADCLVIQRSEYSPSCIYAYGKGDDRFNYKEVSIPVASESDFMQLCLTLNEFSSEAAKAKFVRKWAEKRDAPLQPYNP